MSPPGPRLAEAFAYALALHGDQVRKRTSIPYISHLLAVASLVIENGGDEDQAIAALLHDGPEDQGGEATLEEIADRFGERVARIVRDCSDTFETPKPPWRKRKERYIEHAGAGQPGDFLLVSLADKVHNLRSIVYDRSQIGDEIWDRFQGGRQGSLWYFESLYGVFKERIGETHRALVDELGKLIEELGGLAQSR